MYKEIDGKSLEVFKELEFVKMSRSRIDRVSEIKLSGGDFLRPGWVKTPPRSAQGRQV